MKSLGASHTRHLSDSCMPVAGPQEPICPLTPDPHGTYLLSPSISHYGTLDPHMHHFPPTSPIALQSDCLLPLNNQLTTSNTFPRFQFPSQVDQTEYAQVGKLRDWNCDINFSYLQILHQPFYEYVKVEQLWSHKHIM